MHHRRGRESRRSAESSPSLVLPGGGLAGLTALVRRGLENEGGNRAWFELRGSFKQISLLQALRGMESPLNQSAYVSVS